MKLSEANRAALRRVLRYVVIPALLVGLDAARGYLEAGSLAVNWGVVATVAFTAALAGASKWLREVLDVDLKVI